MCGTFFISVLIYRKENKKMNTQKHDEQSPRAKRRENLLALVEGAMMVALAIVLDLLCKLIPSVFPYGGSISLFSIPLFSYSYRRGWRWGLGAGLVLAVVQMITGFYAPPANTLFAVFLCCACWWCGGGCVLRPAPDKAEYLPKAAAAEPASMQ
jgi:hypothetical protein